LDGVRGSIDLIGCLDQVIDMTDPSDMKIVKAVVLPNGATGTYVRASCTRGKFWDLSRGVRGQTRSSAETILLLQSRA